MPCGRVSTAWIVTTCSCDHGGRGLGLACEPPPRSRRRGQLGGQELDRHQPVEGPVPGQEDEAHPAPANQADHVVRPELAQLSRFVGGIEQAQGKLVIVGRHGLGILHHVACGRGTAGRRGAAGGRPTGRFGPPVGRGRRGIAQVSRWATSSACSSSGRPSSSRRSSRSVVGQVDMMNLRENRTARSHFRRHPTCSSPSIRSISCLSRAITRLRAT